VVNSRVNAAHVKAPRALVLCHDQSKMFIATLYW
jgi:hypothetical protein